MVGLVRRHRARPRPPSKDDSSSFNQVALHAHPRCILPTLLPEFNPAALHALFPLYSLRPPYRIQSGAPRASLPVFSPPFPLYSIRRRSTPHHFPPPPPCLQSGGAPCAPPLYSPPPVFYQIPGEELLSSADGSVVPLDPKTDLVRYDFASKYDSSSKIDYNYRVRRVAYLDEAGILLKTAAWLELEERVKAKVCRIVVY